MKHVEWSGLTKSGLTTCVTRVANGTTAGIGHGPPDPRLRATAEALERLWQRRGPSPSATVYSLGTDRTLLASGAEVDGSVSDSSGTAIHTNPHLAIHGACLEFIERQSIISHWVGQTGYELIDVPGDIYHEGRNHGCEYREISIVDGVSVILAIFRSQTGSVQYSVGASASLEPQEAIAKAGRELDQALLAMNDNLLRSKQNRPLLDNLQENYVHANSYETYLKWPQERSSRMLLGAFEDGSIVRTLMSLPQPPNLVLDRIGFDGTMFVIARVFSSSWFLGFRDTCVIPAAFTMSGIQVRQPSPVPFG